jgi:putative glutamine amidotransferase
MPAGQNPRPRVGIPYRTSEEEKAEKRGAYDKYVCAVEAAGGLAVEISLALGPEELGRVAESVDALVLPGSPADVEPGRYGAQKHGKTAAADPLREETDTALLENAFRNGKPVLAICYGTQNLNVFLGGTLVQDIASETGSKIEHAWRHRGAGTDEPRHAIEIAADSRLAELAGAEDVVVNSSHHQSVLEPGRGLRVVAKAPDGVVEALEWTGGPAWVFAAQWHPERMAGDDAGSRLSRKLFTELVAAARGVATHG